MIFECLAASGGLCFSPHTQYADNCHWESRGESPLRPPCRRLLRLRCVKTALRPEVLCPRVGRSQELQAVPAALDSVPGLSRKKRCRIRPRKRFRIGSGTAVHWARGMAGMLDADGTGACPQIGGERLTRSGIGSGERALSAFGLGCRSRSSLGNAIAIDSSQFCRHHPIAGRRRTSVGSRP